jgi:hypothetical protein
MKIALHWTVEVDPDAWAARHGIDRKRVREHIRAYVQYELSQLPVALTPVVREPAEPASKPAAAADGREWTGRPLPADPGSVTPGLAAAAASGQPPADATASRPIAGDSRQPSSAPVALAGTTAAPGHVAGPVLRPAAPGPDPMHASPGWEHHPTRPARRRLVPALAVAIAALMLAVAAVQPGPADPPAVTPLPAPAAATRRARTSGHPVPDPPSVPGGFDLLDECTQAARGGVICVHRGAAIGDLNPVAMCEACRRTVREALEALALDPPLRWHRTWDADS